MFLRGIVCQFHSILILQGNMFIVNLAISDIGIFLTQGPLMFINAITSRYWMWGASMCKLYGCLGAVFGKP